MVDDMGMSANQASERLTDLRMQHAASGSSIDSDWYGQHIIKAGTQVTETTVRNAAEKLGYSHMDIVSGAGHDACWINRVAPTAMVWE